MEIVKSLMLISHGAETRSRGCKTFPCSTQLSMKFKLLIITRIAKINGNFRFISQKLVIYPANIC